MLNARADERERQRKHRAQEREERGADPPLSQAGLTGQVRVAVEEIVEEFYRVRIQLDAATY